MWKCQCFIIGLCCATNCAVIPPCWYRHCCRSQSAQVWKLLGNVPKPVPNLRTACVQAWTLLAHWSSAWPLLGHWRCIHAWALAWAHVYISKQFPSLNTPTFTAVNHAGTRHAVTQYAVTQYAVTQYAVTHHA